jgi:hypothetical protein
MATKVRRPTTRPVTKLGLASDVRSSTYQTRSGKPKKARGVKSTPPPGARR